MVIQIIYQFDIITDKAKNYTPVSIAPYRKKTFLFTGQRVQPVAGKIDIIRFCCHVQQTKDSSQLRSVFGLDTSFNACLTTAVMAKKQFSGPTMPDSTIVGTAIM
jgi:hypothetical protein